MMRKIEKCDREWRMKGKGGHGTILLEPRFKWWKVAVSEKLKGKVFQTDGAENAMVPRWEWGASARGEVLIATGFWNPYFAHSFIHLFIVYSSKYVLSTYSESFTFPDIFPWPCDTYIFMGDTDKKQYVIRKLCNTSEDKSIRKQKTSLRRTRSGHGSGQGGPHWEGETGAKAWSTWRN